MSLRSLIFPVLLSAVALGGCDKQSPTTEQAAISTAAPLADEVPDNAAAERVLPVEADKIDRSHKGQPAIAATFKTPDGETLSLADFAGKPVLLNLWATWCAPCVAEMPTIDTLAGRLGDKVTVLTVSQDLEGSKAVAPFFARGRFPHLKAYLDDKAALSIGFQANLPTTILFDATGHELWRVQGGADWAGAQAAELLGEAK